MSEHLQCAGSYLHNITTQTHLASHENKGNSSMVNKQRVVDAYGAQKCPKVVRLLQDEDSQVVTQALKTLTCMLKIPADVTVCLQCDVLPALETFMLSEDNTIRTYTSQCLELLAMDANGRNKMLQEETSSKIIVGLGDSVEKVRRNILSCAVHLSSRAQNAMQLSECGCIEKSIHAVRTEKKSELRGLALHLLKNCVNDSKETSILSAIDLDAVPSCVECLYDSDDKVRQLACNALEVLCLHNDAQVQAIDKECIPVLCNLLQDKNWEVTSASAGTLMIISVHDRAKQEMLTAGGVKCLGPLLKNPKFAIQLKVLKLIASLGQYPPAKDILKTSETTKTLRKMIDDTDADKYGLLAKSASIALQVLLWKA